MYNLGLVSVSFRDRTPEEICAACAEAGLSLIEWGGDVHAKCDDKEALENIASLQREYGIACSSYGTYFRLGVHDADSLRRHIAAARVLGTDVLRIWAGSRGSAEYADGDREALFESAREAAKIAEEEGVTLCTECHVWTYTDEYAAALELLEAGDSPAFRTYWQPCQFKTEEYNGEYAKAVAAYARHVHVFNWHGSEKLPLAEGTGVWRRYLADLGGEHVLLLEFMPDDNIASLKREADALREIVRGL